MKSWLEFHISPCSGFVMDCDVFTFSSKVTPHISVMVQYFLFIKNYFICSVFIVFAFFSLKVGTIF